MAPRVLTTRPSAERRTSSTSSSSARQLHDKITLSMEELKRVRDITNVNFEENFPFIKETIESATFVAFDAEFTGISAADVKQNSLFDTPKERYTTMRNNLKDFIMSQFGLTTFQFDREANKYLATTFVFYLFPRSVGTLHRKFNAETSAFQFLAQFDFDFSKLMGTGVTYLSSNDSGFVSTERPWLASAVRSRRNSALARQPPALSRVQWTEMENEVARLAGWLNKRRGLEDPGTPLDESQESPPLDESQGNEGSPLADAFSGKLRTKNPRLMDRLGHVLRKAFPGVLITTAYDPQSGQWSNVYRDIGRDPALYRSRLANSKAGFRRVFTLLSELKKPIVGHNPILDLMLMYNQFHAPLPVDYAAFKAEMHALFPQVYDTKFLSYELRDVLSRESVWDGNDLAMLYAYFETGVGSFLVKCSPRVELAPGSKPEPKPGSKAESLFHEAGWDSYCTGYCFVRIMHFFATQINSGCGMDAKPLTATQHLFSVKQYKNRVNISRANINNINLAGPEPASKKPQWLVVELLDRSLLRSSKITDVVIAHTDMSLDVKQISLSQALIAVNSASAARELSQAFADKKEFHVSAYNPLKHNRLVRSCLWAGIISSGGVVATLLVLGKRL